MYKKTILILLAMALLAMAALPAAAEEPENPHANTVLVAVNPFGPIIGLYTGSVEFPITRDMTVVVEPEYFNFRASLVALLLDAANDEDWDELDFNIVSYGGRVGINFFPEQVHNGLLVGGSLGYARTQFSFEGTSVFTNTVQVGGRVGYRFIFDFLALTPFAELNLSRITADVGEIYDDLGIEDEFVQNRIESAYGVNFRFGLAFALALGL
ncbi:hypothetical protein [Spirochaeta africana]|uniref:Outer membrane protein beta-barrel domain-containing protein n=1 Tax=Spirochaeta africana (strain ATCC 700263 / DSM 8902 / Z-7692) TaxID=889378 RepID=H9UGB4_SPIAZ|nr:hypothetical protein [Spirochaeta africana]AFG36557.1 hypothetical protein Spiaf_0454 [Spirochaeta africana DSM 8902]